MRAQNRIARAIADRTARQSAYAAALAEWRNLARELPDEERARVDTPAACNTLVALLGTGRDEELDRRWATLAPAQRASKDFVRLAVNHLVGRGRTREAQDVLIHAGAYHGSPRPEWLAELDEELRAGEVSPAPPPPPFSPSALTDEHLRQAVSESLRRPALARARIFGNEASMELGEFLLEHHVRAAVTIQKLEATLAKLREEDKYSDVPTALLNAQLSQLVFSVHSQSRGGLSGSGSRRDGGGGVGERDRTIESGGVEFALAEALRLDRASAGAQVAIHKHLTKLLERYDRTGLDQGFMVAYVEDEDLATIAISYANHVASWASTDAPLVGSVAPRNSPGACVQIFQTKHQRAGGRQTMIFHILIRVAERPTARLPKDPSKPPKKPMKRPNRATKKSER